MKTIQKLLIVVLLLSPAFGQVVQPSHGGTGQSAYSKGNLLCGTASGLGLLAAGTNGNVLEADSSQTCGIKWASLSSNVAFSSLTSGTNTGAAMVVGSGASLISTGGSIGANNTGVFSPSQQNEYLQSILNSCSPGTEWHATQGFSFGTDAMAGCVAVPNTATTQANAVSGYANSVNTSGLPAVGGFFQGRALVNGAKVWGGNVVAQDTSGLTTGVWLTGMDANINPQNATSAYTTIVGFNATLSAPTSGYFGNGHVCTLYSSTGAWSSCFYSADTATITGIFLGTIPGGSSSLVSQVIQFHYLDSSAGSHAPTLGTDILGNLAYLGGPIAGNLAVQGNPASFSALTAPNVSITPIGADPSGATDSYTAIEAAITAGISAGKCVFLPVGTYKVSAGLTYNSANVCFSGPSALSTTITASGSGYNVLTAGPGTQTTQTPSCQISGISFIGHGKPAVGSPTGISALQLNAIPECNVHDIEVDSADIGIDIINNSFGSQFTNIRGCFGGTCNVGINLRTGAQSGSDISFYNPWIDGAVAGVEISGGGGGYHFWGGQINAGQGTGGANDSAGAVIMGLDYLTAATGESNADFHGVSFEGTNYAWIFRTFQQVNLSLYSISADPADAAHPAIGFFKGTTMNNGRVQLYDTAISGNWSAASLVSAAGSFSGVYWWEYGTYTAASQPVINSVSTYVQSMAAQSGILPNAVVTDNSGAFNTPKLSLPGATSGISTITPPAIAGTSTNPIVFSNVIQTPVGSNGNDGIQIGAAGVGMYNFSSGNLVFQASATDMYFQFAGATAVHFQSAGILPNAANTESVGTAATPWANGYFTTTGIGAVTGTNAAGSSETILGGLGTGNAAPGPVFVDSGTKSTTSSSTAQTQVHRQVVNDTKTLSNTTATATTILSLNVANDNSAGVVVRYTIIAKSATDTCTISGVVTAVAETNSGGTSKSAVNATTGIGQVSICTGADTFAATFAISAANPAVLQVTPSWVTIVPTSVYIIYSYDDLSDASTTI